MPFSEYPRITATIASIFGTVVVFAMSAGPAIEPVARFVA